MALTRVTVLVVCALVLTTTHLATSAPAMMANTLHPPMLENADLSSPQLSLSQSADGPLIMSKRAPEQSSQQHAPEAEDADDSISIVYGTLLGSNVMSK